MTASPRARTAFVALLAALAALLVFIPPASAVTWTGPAKIDDKGLWAVSCPSTSFCAAVDEAGRVLTTNDPAGAWSTTPIPGLDPSTDVLYGIACPTAELCVAVGKHGHVVTSTNPTGGAGAWSVANVDAGRALYAVSCPTTTLCVAVDEAGYVVTSTDPTGDAYGWKSKPISVQGLVSVSCATEDVCVAGGGGGLVLSTGLPRGGAEFWHQSVIGDSDAVVFGVSCPTETMCAAITDTGVLGASNNARTNTPTWTQSTPQLPGDLSPYGLECATPSACYTFDKTFVASTTDLAGGPQTWTSQEVVPPGGLVSAINCASVTRCVAVDLTGHAVVATVPPPRTLTVALAGSGSGSVTSAPGGITCGAECAYEYPQGSAVTLTATPADDTSTFEGWSGGGCSGTETCTVTLDDATTVTATFSENPYVKLDLYANAGSGSGAVWIGGRGVDCRTACFYAAPRGFVISLDADADAGSRFDHWSGGGCDDTSTTCQFTFNEDTVIQAYFVALPKLTVTIGGTGDGAVTSDVGDIDCGSICSDYYDPGTDVTLTATPTEGSRFAGWSGGGCDGTGTCTVAMDAAYTVTATFTSTDEVTPPVPTTPPAHTPAAPNTRLTKTTVNAKKRTARFTFTATGSVTRYRCALTAAHKKVVYKTCRSPVTFRKLKPGRYTFTVVAVGRGGTDRTPARKSITMRRR
ncbi:InlB B-repeat-containing protein [Nocardioides sp. URHA0020]|uniref:InlB B-repeat-containing protein n=1 Tax=Nocardioides sp. URHA0020 TaxID=1380392 RepID=UPI00048DA861|nr:hypothetical protein [Nocardioides sp. URHA0020]